MENMVIPAQSRTVKGTKGAADVRREGRIPAVIYGEGEPQTISVTLHDVRHAIYTPEFHVVDVDVDGSKVRCILKDVQYHPVTDDVIHIDFLQLVPGRKVKVEVPVRFAGQSAGLKAGGKLMQKVRKIKIKAAPEDLVNELVLDVTDLTLGQSVRVRDIKVGEGVEILNSPGIPVASVEVPRALKSLEAEAAKAPEGEAAPDGEKKEGEKKEGEKKEGAKKEGGEKAEAAAKE